jgi:hypothetical protein
LWEGQVEDTILKLGEDGFRTEVSCFGLRRRLEQTSVKRIWVKRDMTWTNLTIDAGSDIFPGSGVPLLNSLPQSEYYASVGQYDKSDLTKFGIRLLGGTGMPAGYGLAQEFILPASLIYGVYGTILSTDVVNYNFQVGTSSDAGVSWTGRSIFTANGAFARGAVESDRVRIAIKNLTGGPGIPANCDFYDLRFISGFSAEDAPGGFYGGTILRDLISLIPELTVGIIEDGNDFLINQMDRTVRDTALSVVEEVSGYYSQREWSVWENGRFDWFAHNLDEPQWLLTVPDLAGLELTSSIDSLVKNVYLSYVEVPTFQSKEATAVSTDQRNPYVKNGKTKDAVVNVPFVMTNVTSQQLATVLARLQGGYIPAAGTVTLSPTKQLTNATGTRKPACMIRGGENIVISDLPKTDLFAQGRDGETLFHVSACETNFEENKVTLTVESLDRRSDVLLARLAAATRSVGG